MNDYLKERELWWPVSPELMAGYRVGSHNRKDAMGSLVWRKNCERHRDGDKPARICEDGTLEWYKNGVWHRDGDKPARISADGTLEWYKNGLRHRDGDKPAYIGAGGTLVWRKNGLRHRITGPAVIHPNNEHEYWINEVNITKEVESWLKTRKYTYPFTPEQQVEFVLTFG
jgi:hypothetical protein